MTEQPKKAKRGPKRPYWTEEDYRERYGMTKAQRREHWRRRRARQTGRSIPDNWGPSSWLDANPLAQDAALLDLIDRTTTVRPAETFRVEAEAPWDWLSNANRA